MSSKSKIATSKIAELADQLIRLQTEILATTKDLRKTAGGRKRNTTATSTESEGSTEPATKGASRSAWQEWAKTCTTTFASDYAAHLADVGKKADVMNFAAKCRNGTHVAEWTKHETDWATAHPKEAKPAKSSKSKIKDAPAPVIISEVEESSLLHLPAPMPIGMSKSKVASEDERSVKKSKKSVAASAASSDDESSVKKPKKSVAAVAAATSDDESSMKKMKKSKAPSKADEKVAAKAAAMAASNAAATAEPPTPWKYRGKDYLKNESNQIWQAGDDGEVGDWVGTFDGKKIEKSEGPA